MGLYDLFYTILELFQNWRRKEDLRILFRLLQPSKDDVILDVGAGTGLISDRIANLCDEVYAVEPDERRLNYIKKKHPQVKSFSGKAETIPFPEEYFTKIIAIFSFHHFENQDQALSEFSRVIRKKGLLMIREINPNNQARGRKYMEKRIMKLNVNFLSSSALKKKVESHDFLTSNVVDTRHGYIVMAQKVSSNQTQNATSPKTFF